MATLETRQTTWRAWFRVLDANHDEVLTAEDWKIAGENFVKVANLSTEAAAVAMGIYSEWGEMIFGLGGLKGGPTLSEDLFIKNVTDLYTRDPQECKRLVQAIFTKLLECSDTDKDGFISEKEYIIRNKAFGLTEEQSKQIYAHMGSPGPLGIAITIAAEYFGNIAIGEKDFNKIKSALPSGEKK